MPNRTNPLHEADRLARWQLTQLGSEIRLARIQAGRTRGAVSRAVGTSVARISLLERGLVPTVTYRQMARVSAAVGLKVSLRAYPAARRLLDAPQLELLARVKERSNSAWRWELEVPMPIAGDLRAADARASIPGCTIACELWTRPADWQAQSRSALLKRRDLGADRLLVVLRDTRANRAAVRDAGIATLDAFPIGPRAVLKALAEGRDPEGNGLLFL